MRICVVVPQFPVRSETFVVDHIRGLLARGHAVTVVPFVPSPRPSEAPLLVADVIDATAPKPRTPRTQWGWKLLRGRALLRHGARPIRFALDSAVTDPASPGRRLLVAERVASSGPFDVIHAQFGHSFAAAVGLRRHALTHAPIVGSVHGQDVNVNAQADPQRFAALALQCAAVTVGTEPMGDVVRRLGVDDAHIRVWAQGVDAGRIAERAGGSGEEFRVLSVCRLVAFKGIDDSLRVIAAVRDRVPELRYTIVGDGPERAGLEELARALHVDDITQFVGAKDHRDALAAHGRADVFLQMGKTGPDGSMEGQGVGVLEASISRLPVVVTTSGGLREVAVEGVTGFVVAPGAIEQAAHALVRLANEPDLRLRLGEGGRAFATQQFSLEATTDRIVSIYEEVLTSAAVRPS